MAISSPAPVPYEGGEGRVGPPGCAYQAVSPELVAAAFQGTSSKESPGPDGVGPLAIQCVYDWEPDRVVALIRAHIRLVTHQDRWKVARGVTAPNPGKDGYSHTKSYQVISLLNCQMRWSRRSQRCWSAPNARLQAGFAPASTDAGCSARPSTRPGPPSPRHRRPGAGK